MRSIEETINALKNGEYDDKLTYLYSCDKNDVKKYSDRYIDVINGFEETFGKDGEIALFSAPGRTEIGGNHTDHQHGCVLADFLSYPMRRTLSGVPIRNTRGSLAISSSIARLRASRTVI